MAANETGRILSSFKRDREMMNLGKTRIDIDPFHFEVRESWLDAERLRKRLLRKATFAVSQNETVIRVSLNEGTEPEVEVNVTPLFIGEYRSFNRALQAGVSSLQKKT